jgi:hypothetical protein
MRAEEMQACGDHYPVTDFPESGAADLPRERRLLPADGLLGLKGTAEGAVR